MLMKRYMEEAHAKATPFDKAWIITKLLKMRQENWKRKDVSVRVSWNPRSIWHKLDNESEAGKGYRRKSICIFRTQVGSERDPARSIYRNSSARVTKSVMRITCITRTHWRVWHGRPPERRSSRETLRNQGHIYRWSRQFWTEAKFRPHVRSRAIRRGTTNDGSTLFQSATISTYTLLCSHRVLSGSPVTWRSINESAKSGTAVCGVTTGIQFTAMDPTACRWQTATAESVLQIWRSWLSPERSIA